MSLGRRPVTLGVLADALDAELVGDPALTVSGAAPLESAQAGDLSYIADGKHRRFLEQTGATALIMDRQAVAELRCARLLVDNPRLAFARALGMLYPEPALTPGIDSTARVDETAAVDARASIGPYVVVLAGARIASGAVIGAHSYVGRDVEIGEETRLWPRATVLDRCRIGRRCILHPGSVVGGDGFGYARDGATWVKSPQVGAVILGDDVEVGVNTAIDRGALGDTVIGRGVKLDNLIQVAHNVHIGEDTAVAGCTGIAGSTRVGRRCLIGGGVVIGGHLDIVDDVTILGRSAITHSISEPGAYSSTMAAQVASDWRRNAVRFRHLDEMARRLKALEQKMQDLSPGEPRE